MSSDVALRARDVGKMYRVRSRVPAATPSGAPRARAWWPLPKSRRDDFWAVRSVSFDVTRGEILGVIGRNGAGKSTLLKLLSRVTVPTEGQIELYGKVGSLLEVGTGFHPELTGRENIYLNGTILGMRRRDIDRHFEEIVAFAGVERFLDTAVKRYSSGMYVRLAFAVAAHLDTDILLVDEVLAVGDAVFQRKCLGKMNEVAHDGRTVLLVSHNLAVVSALAARCLVLDQGRVAMLAPVDEALEAYGDLGDRSVDGGDLRNAPRPEDWHSREVELLAASLSGGLAIVEATQSVRAAVTVVAHRPCPEPRLTYTLHRGGGEPVGTAFSEVLPSIEEEQTVTWDVSFDLRHVAPGRYYLTLAVGTGEQTLGYEHFDVVTDVLHFEVAPDSTPAGAEVWHYGWGATRLVPARVRVM